MSSERVKKICEYIDRNKAKNYPIKNQTLMEFDDYVKNGYLRMLAVVLQVGNNVTKSQMNLYERIIAGADAENTTEDYMRQAMEIEIKEYSDFVNTCKEEQLKYRFVLDAILLAVDGDNKEEQLKFIALFCEDVKIQKEELDYLASMARAILEQSEGLYVDTFVEKRLGNVPEKLFAEYMSSLFDKEDKIYESDNAIIFRPLPDECITPTNISMLQQTKKAYVGIIGANINFKKWDKSLVFKEKENIVFENCVFKGAGCNEIEWEFHLLDLEKCNNVLIYNCKFEKFDTPVLKLEKVKNVQIATSSFKNCIYCYDRGDGDWKSLGGVIYSDEPAQMGNIRIERCVFDECGGKNSRNYYRSEIISNCKVISKENKFVNCWNYSSCSFNMKNGHIDPEDSRRTLFSSESKAFDCIFENSAKFNKFYEEIS